MSGDRTQPPHVLPNSGVAANEQHGDLTDGGRIPHLLINPADDDEFTRFAQVVLHRGRGLDAFEVALHERYPSSAVHERIISGEPWLVWYVYRDGHWVGRSEPGVEGESNG